jgi:hypothetical protein
MRSDSTLGSDLAADRLKQIDGICNRFEADWQEDRWPDLADYLSGAPAEGRPTLFRDLLRLDLEFRRERGDRPDAAVYIERFPDLTGVIDAVFDSVELAGETRCPGPDRSQGSTIASPSGNLRPMEGSLSDGFTVVES